MGGINVDIVRQAFAAFEARDPELIVAIARPDMVFEPVTTMTGPASPVYDAASNFVTPAMNGDLNATEAARQMRDDMQGNLH